MLNHAIISAALALATLPFAVQGAQLTARNQDPICAWIERAISSASNVYYPGDTLYNKGVAHWATTANQVSKCVVEPGTAADVGTVLRIVGGTRTPFAVKGAGHSPNPKFASTTGVHISMYRFNNVTYDADAQTAEIGTGLVWDNVYDALAPHGVNIVGGRVPGVGVAGFTLGGGYSWKTNQFGLTIDTLVAFELVRPDGKVVKVTHESDPQLFMGLKGGFNNFGIVTKFTLKTHPQSEVWGGPTQIGADHIDEVTDATVEWDATATDPKAQVMTTYTYARGELDITLFLFYDGPTPPAGMFDRFLAIPNHGSDVKTRPFADMVQSTPTAASYGFRGIFNAFSVLDTTRSLVDVIINETQYWGQQLSAKTGIITTYAVEPFLRSMYSHNTEQTAFPPTRSIPFLPFNIYYAWLNSTYDEEFYNAARVSTKVITDAAVAEGQRAAAEAPLYPNNAIFDTPISKVYGDNLPALRAVKRRVDPANVMGLAGGWKV
ncbi:hypothetical protein NLJ89_g3482 [Agrocybe chaxingu]|uniref:FAD-binding PCMH-type domain-containing protein n=1 Tax=Agrocybe chaxingu TaxID=84603 RepID=A0A9W8MYB0_9AGAR|nr:hypothetical protein NLJ89_g3482 [Agrocybe chaxingu]